MSSRSENNGVKAQSSLNPQLVHRVLLTEKSQFSSLSISGAPRHVDKAITFDDFCNMLKPSSETTQSLEDTMKRAYRDKVLNVLYNSGNIQPLQQLLLELHQAMRSLIPNRKDLHSVLNDDEVRMAISPEQVLPLVIKSGDALSRLESEFNSESTITWLKSTQSENMRRMTLKETLEFLVNSIMYLLLKAEVCQQEKQDFFLAHVWAPQIHNKGHLLERQAFQERFGKFDDPDTAPLTRQWIRELVVAQASHKDELSKSTSARATLVKRGWIQDILFRALDRPPLSMPEIFAMDLDQLYSIRLVTKSAAAGSALALHACTAAGKPSSVLQEPLEASSALELRRVGVVEAMANQLDRTDYEDNVANAVVRLAKEWNPSLSAHAETTLTNQARSVLRGEDPVIRLLDTRMKEVFTELLSWKQTTVNMQSGRVGNKNVSDNNTAFLTAAKTAFCDRGLSFYATDLANVSHLAKKVVDLAWAIYGDPLLNKMILEEVC